MKRACLFVGTLFTAFLVSHSVDASERILNFKSAITVHADATLDVTETITVKAENKKIRHGIFRDFPTDYRDAHGNRVITGFNVTAVTQDDRPAEYTVGHYANGIRVRIGSANEYLDVGEHIYAIHYKTHRQLGFFSDHDELYWNVTGNGWDFAISAASIIVTLPPGASDKLTFTDSYMGPQGSKKSGDAYPKLLPDNSIQLKLDGYLAPREGFTIAIGWPKGFVTEPTQWQELLWFATDNSTTSMLAVGFVALFSYYLLVWFLLGKDPRGGTIIPLYVPPQKFSPAGARFVSQLGDYDNQIMAATIVSLAVKGWLKIEGGGSEGFSLEKTGNEIGELSQEELQLYHSFFYGRNSVNLKNTYADVFLLARKELKNGLDAYYAAPFFHRNSVYSLLGHASTLVLCFWAIGFADRAHFWPATLFLLIAYGAAKILWRWRVIVLQLRQSSGFQFFKYVIGLLFVPFLLAGALYVFSLWLSDIVSCLLGALAVLNVVFHDLLKAPTRLGRMMIDQIKGFKMYLGTAEGSYLDTMTPPEKTPELFEKYLPYAIALEVENAWADKFTDILKEASITRQNTTIWYRWNQYGHGFTNSFVSEFSSAISSASIPPGSSSGSSGGGGFSGGGGGGGGGGGW